LFEAEEARRVLNSVTKARKLGIHEQFLSRNQGAGFIEIGPFRFMKRRAGGKRKKRGKRFDTRTIDGRK